MKSHFKLAGLAMAALAILFYVGLLRFQQVRVKNAMASSDTSRMLMLIGNAMTGVTLNESRSEWTSFGEAVEDLRSAGYSDADFTGNLVVLRRSTPISMQSDVWGNELSLHRLSQPKMWALRSAGPNGLDESGGGDDIEVQVPLFFDW